MEMKAGQGTPAWPGSAVMYVFFRATDPHSCELVLFMLMVSLSCEGDHAGAAHAKSILAAAFTASVLRQSRLGQTSYSHERGARRRLRRCHCVEVSRRGLDGARPLRQYARR